MARNHECAVCSNNFRCEGEGCIVCLYEMIKGYCSTQCGEIAYSDYRIYGDKSDRKSVV